MNNQSFSISETLKANIESIWAKKHSNTNNSDTLQTKGKQCSLELLPCLKFNYY